MPLQILKNFPFRELFLKETSLRHVRLVVEKI